MYDSEHEEQWFDPYGMEYERECKYAFDKPSFADWLKAKYPDEYKSRLEMLGPYGD